MWQSLIPLVVRFLLSALAKGLPMEQWKIAAKTWVIEVVPGEWFDEIAWSIIDNAWDLIVGEVIKAKPLGLSSGSGMDSVFKAVAYISNDVTKQISREF